MGTYTIALLETQIQEIFSHEEVPEPFFVK